MKVRRIVPMLLVAAGLALVLAGLSPRLRGRPFNTALFAPGMTFMIVGGAVRRRQRQEREREERDGGR